MDRILERAEHLRGTEAYWALLKAEEIEKACLGGMLTLRELDAMTLLRPCFMLREQKDEEALALACAEHVRDFCLDLDRVEPVDRGMWIVLGTLLYENPFDLFETYLVSALRCENVERERILEPWDYLELEKHGLSPRLTDPRVYASAVAYIKKRGRARWMVQQWLLEDVDRFYGIRREPFFPAKKVLSFFREGEARFAPGQVPTRPFRRGQHVTLQLIDNREMDFQPEVRILSDRKAVFGREARGWAWYRNCRWLLRICYDPDHPENAFVDRYSLYPFEFMGFHVLTFIVLGGDYRSKEPLSVGDTARIKLMDLWGRDLNLSGAVTTVHETSFDMKAFFPDRLERKITVYTSMRAADYRGDIAAVERSSRYPLPRWAERTSTGERTV